MALQYLADQLTLFHPGVQIHPLLLPPQFFPPFGITFNNETKGQLILKCPFGVFKSPKKPTKIFPGFLP